MVRRCVGSILSLNSLMLLFGCVSQQGAMTRLDITRNSAVQTLSQTSALDNVEPDTSPPQTSLKFDPRVQKAANDWPPPVHDDGLFTFLRAEQLEYRLRDDGPDVARWETQGWYGTDYQKLWVKLRQLA